MLLRPEDRAMRPFKRSLLLLCVMTLQLSFNNTKKRETQVGEGGGYHRLGVPQELVPRSSVSVCIAPISRYDTIRSPDCGSFADRNKSEHLFDE